MSVPGAAPGQPFSSVSEIHPGITAAARMGQVPFTLVQTGDFKGIGGHLNLFLEAPGDFGLAAADAVQPGTVAGAKHFYRKVDLHTDPASPLEPLPDSSWSGSAFSSESTSSNMSSSSGSGIIGRFTVKVTNYPEAIIN